jgi:hypothetical protein
MQRTARKIIATVFAIAAVFTTTARAQQPASPDTAVQLVQTSQADDRRVNLDGKPGTIFRRPNNRADLALRTYLNLDGQEKSFELVSIRGSQTAFILLKRPDISITADEQGKLTVTDSSGKPAGLDNPEVIITPDTPPPTPAAFRDTPVRTYAEPNFVITPIEGDPTKVKIELKTGAKTEITVEAQRGKNTDGTLSTSKFYLMYPNGNYTEYDKKEAGVLPDGQQVPAQLDVRAYIRNSTAAQPSRFNYYTKDKPLEIRFVEGTQQYWLKYDDKKPPMNVHPFTKITTSPLGRVVGLGGLDPLGGMIVNTLNKQAIKGGEFQASYSNFPTIWRLEATKDDGFVVIGGYERPEVKTRMEEAVKAHGGAKGKVQ